MSGDQWRKVPLAISSKSYNAKSESPFEGTIRTRIGSAVPERLRSGEWQRPLFRPVIRDIGT